MENLTPYRLSIVAAIVVLVLSVGVVMTFGGISNATPYLTLVGTVAIPALIGLFKLEQNAVVRDQQHAQNQADIRQTNTKIDALASALTQKGGQ